MSEELLAGVVAALERIANAQEGMLAIAAEARVERLELSKKMKDHFKAGFQGGPDGNNKNPNQK